MGRLFGTDGVRGVANLEPMTAEMALDIGRAVAYVCKRHKEHRHRVVIGKDTRISGYMLESALEAGICSMGVDVLLVGPVPTPGIAYLTHSMRADAGVVISASHNPYQDNGIKIFSRDGFKLPDAEEDQIEEMITSGHIRDIRPTADEIGKARSIDDATGRYVVFCKNTFPDDISLEGMKIVLDCANGATYKAAPMVFSELGADVTSIHVEPNGVNINDRCGSQHTEDLRARVVETGADIGLAFDGDGDRLMAVDEKGQQITGDHLMVMIAKRLKAQGRLANNLVVSTVMSNFGFGLAVKALGIDYVAAKVGDRYVLEEMQKRGATIGGEESGHVILLDRHTTGDGIVTALALLAALRDSGGPLSELSKLMTLFPQKTINVDVTRKPPLEELTDVQTAIKVAEAELADKGRVLVRYSGTQSMCRVMVEGPTQEITDRLSQQIAETVRRSIG